MTVKPITLISALSLCTAITLNAQVDQASELFVTLSSKDSLLFNVGFNTCNLGPFEDLISDDFEFYHDQAGITTSKALFLTSIKEGLCKLSYKPRRELVKGSLQVFPLHNKGVLYGAIQIGRHRFYAIGRGQKGIFHKHRQIHARLENRRWPVEIHQRFEL
jgi:hypothetical protein